MKRREEKRREEKTDFFWQRETLVIQYCCSEGQT